MIHTASRLERNDRGATATEYGLLIGFIALAILVGVGAFGTALNGYFNSIATWAGTVM